MKKSGYRTIFHIYLIFFLSLLGTTLSAIGLFLLLITVQTSDGATVRSDWPKIFTENFREQIIFIDDKPQVKQSGIELLQDNSIGLQILDDTGYEIYSYGKPKKALNYYSNTDIVRLFHSSNLGDDKITSFIGEITNKENGYAYIIYFPIEVKKVTMYLNGERFTGGKTVIISIVAILLSVILISGIIYGFCIARVISRLTMSIKDISKRSYLPIQNRGAFSDLYDSLNTLDTEIKASDRLRQQTEKMRRDWIANITHDLKTPLSPIKGYAEILQDDTIKTDEQYKRYAGVMLKNAVHMENLIDDLKLTYQLENGMVPVNRQEQNLIRFSKELVIDILNNPEYESRSIHFESTEETILFSFDPKLLTRAFQNLMINALVHGQHNAEVTLQISVSENGVKITVADNGKGMTTEETSKLFERYYRGTNTRHKPEGTGLGLAIAKDIVELHGGTISVSSVLDFGTVFLIYFPTN
ncbi:MAG: sensor histidine kinase [Firmicutes bacterium HGW-Firmicutes-7]|nr:MAG: sensor histidine kinase [Firmicutes bacterium HGW-Firmicutes-7]